MTTIIRKEEQPLSPTQISVGIHIPTGRYDGIRERAAAYKQTVTAIMKNFDEQVGTERMLKNFFGEHADIDRLEGPIRGNKHKRRRLSMPETYVCGYVVTKRATTSTLLFPSHGLFVGFLERQAHTIPQGEKELSVLVPEHWGVISYDNLLDRPYALASRLTGRPTTSVASAQNLLLHVGLDPARAGWEAACTELEAYLTLPQTIKEARSVVIQGIGNEIDKTL